jgi:hypothetical protein
MKKRSERILKVLEVARELKKAQNQGRLRLKRNGMNHGAVAHIVVWALLKKREQESSIKHKTKSKNVRNAAKKRVRDKNLKCGKDKWCFIDDSLTKIGRNRLKVRHDAELAFKHAALVKKRLVRGGTKPVEIDMDQFCSDMLKQFYQKGVKKPNYLLIANVANLFHLSEKRQTADTIRQRIFQLK